MHPPDGDNISLWVLPERPETYIRTEISHFPDVGRLSKILITTAAKDVRRMSDDVAFGISICDEAVASFGRTRTDHAYGVYISGRLLLMLFP